MKNLRKIPKQVKLKVYIVQNIFPLPLAQRYLHYTADKQFWKLLVSCNISYQQPLRKGKWSQYK